MRSLYNRLERGNKRIFIRISFSLKIFMKVPVDLESVVKQLAGKKIERIFVSPVLNLQKMTPSRRVSRIFVAVIAIDWNESWASNENLSLFFTFIYLSWEGNWVDLLDQLISIVSRIFQIQYDIFTHMDVQLMQRLGSNGVSFRCNSIRFFFVETRCNEIVVKKYT